MATEVMTGPDGPSSPIYPCSLLWLQNLISCSPSQILTSYPWKGLIAEAGGGPRLQAGVRSHKGPAPSISLTSMCQDHNCFKNPRKQKQVKQLWWKLGLSELSHTPWLCHHTHPGPAPALHAAHLCLPPLEWTFPSKWMSLLACAHKFPRGCILNNIAEAPGGISCSFYAFLRVRREEAWSALAHSHLQDLVGFRAVSKPNPKVFISFPSHLYLTWYKCERAFLKWQRHFWSWLLASATGRKLEFRICYQHFNYSVLSSCHQAFNYFSVHI